MWCFEWNEWTATASKLNGIGFKSVETFECYCGSKQQCSTATLPLCTAIYIVLRLVDYIFIVSFFFFFFFAFCFHFSISSLLLLLLAVRNRENNMSKINLGQSRSRQSSFDFKNTLWNSPICVLMVIIIVILPLELVNILWLRRCLAFICLTSSAFVGKISRCDNNHRSSKTAHAEWGWCLMPNRKPFLFVQLVNLIIIIIFWHRIAANCFTACCPHDDIQMGCDKTTTTWIVVLYHHR